MHQHDTVAARSHTPSWRCRSFSLFRHMLTSTGFSLVREVGNYPYMSSSSSTPPSGCPSAGSAVVFCSAAGEVSVGADPVAGVGVSVPGDALVATGASGAAAAGAGVGVGADDWKAGCIPAPNPSIRRLAASASFLSHARYACNGKTRLFRQFHDSSILRGNNAVCP